MISNSILHHTIIKGIIEHGFAPSVDDLSSSFQATKEEVISALIKLEEYHGVVLHPNKSEVWAIHPFSLSPTNFYVQTDHGAWWGNCAWCSLGVAALVKGDVKITTTIGAETKQVVINIVDQQIQETNYLIHFPIAMKCAWDNVVYTCSNMLLFENEQQIDEWTRKHNIPKGDIQPIEKIWNFSRKWYGNHLNSDWTKWSIDEAKSIFQEFELKGRIWELDDSSERF